MRGVLTMAAAGAVVVAAIAACNAFFDIVPRTAGPTWCEQDAEASVSQYCEDFDRIPQSTSNQETPASHYGDAGITDAFSHSPPNSFAASTETAPDGALVGNLAGLAPVDGGLPNFICQADILAKDVAALSATKPTPGVLAIGGQGATSLAPVMVSLGIVDAGVRIALARLAGANSPPRELGPACVLDFPLSGGATQPWLTLGMRVALETSDSGATCTFTETGRDGAAFADGDPTYIVTPVLGDFPLHPVRIRTEPFSGQAYFAYGLFIGGAAPAFPPIHIDNVLCKLE